MGETQGGLYSLQESASWLVERFSFFKSRGSMRQGTGGGGVLMNKVEVVSDGVSYNQLS